MLYLPRTLQAWDQDAFIDTLTEELNQLEARALPVHECLSQGSHVIEDNDYKFMLLRRSGNEQTVELTIGVFFNSIIAGCACADDPTPADTTSEYGELQIRIHKQTAAAEISVAQV